MFEDGVVYLKAHGSTPLNDLQTFLHTLHAALLSGPGPVATRMQEQSGDFFKGGTGDNSNLLDIEDSDAGQCMNSDPMTDPVHLLEEHIASVLSPLRLLLVLDHIETGTEIRFFLGRLFERCRHLKILLVVGDSSSRQVNGFGVVENILSVGPLSLRSSLRLYARIAPALLTPQRKASFVSALMSAKPDVTVHCRDLTLCSAKLLALLGNGRPSSIVKLACESTPESVDKLAEEGLEIISTLEGKGGNREWRTISRSTTPSTPRTPTLDMDSNQVRSSDKSSDKTSSPDNNEGSYCY
eukprot:CAMPEP_0119053646 /NCGR_PEP_ID=MMETSP1177-20130426/74558_1 /TAXON_ID=2985 /ORGANISM="Ochromonas sp, Strain CCMP1899" /LENGTH=296 /DNA_ID=CAMNT_0007033653 /DNA_START=1195 /DNA_END=2085 /DNA_ORIENTATION=-